MPEFVPATEKQKAFFESLCEKKVVPTEITQGMKLLGFAGGALDKATASAWITLLMNAPYKPVTVTVQAPEHLHISEPASVAVKPLSTYEQFKALPLGYYTVKANGETDTVYGTYGDTGVAIYLVSVKKRKYYGDFKIARRLYRSYDGKPKWQTVSNATIVQAAGGKPPVDINEVAKLGLAMGFCMVCLRMLTDPFSVANGIGPVCAKKYGYQPAAQLAV